MTETISPHGSYSRYVNQRCRCVPCREANREAVREQRANRRRRATTGEIPIPHGTDNGYTNYGCRCRRCRRAHADANASAYNHARRERAR